jgi:hypothetical protein
MKTETNSQPESVVEGNRIIAEFMEVSKEPTLYGSTRVRLNVPSIGSWFEDRGLQYHTSWDWLMSVKHKIDTMDNHEYDVVIWRADCHINDREQILFESSILKGQPKTLIEIVWVCIVEFINWYNQNRNNGR